MRTIRVETPGLFTTVQDLGREGFGTIGVSAAGAADSVALRLGNRLVGNPDRAAALEMTLLGGTFRFSEGALVALTGSDFGASVDGVNVGPYITFEAKPDQILRIGASRAGARSYLCIAGGIHLSPFLGSASTHVLSGLGGFGGRALRKGDVLELGDVSGPQISAERRVAQQVLQQLQPRKVIRVTPGPQSEWFPGSAQKLFYESIYRVAEESNRMGLRLEGPEIPSDASRGEMPSEGVSLGAIQIPESGRPILLFVDQQTTGGYPKIANVIAADLSSVGQLRPRDEIRFEAVTWDEARALLKQQEQLLQSKELIVQ